MSATRKYTKEQKYEAAVHYMLYGQQTAVSKMTGIPVRTICNWVNDDQEFAEMYQMATEKGKQKFDATTSALITDSLKLLDAKIKNEIGLEAKGKGRMSARDTAMTMAILYDKRQLTRSAPTSITEKKSTEHLKELADTFEQITRKKNEDTTKELH